MNRLPLTTILVASFGFAACTDPAEPPPTTPPTGTTGGEGNTFDHDNNNDASVWELLERIQREGPPNISAQFHSCSKMRYTTVGAVLASLGVTVTSTTPLSAGQLYRDGYNAMGGASYANRIRENMSITTSGMSRLFDIFAAASEEIITKITALPRCPGVVLFDPTTNDARADGITCLISSPAQAGHLEFTNLTVRNATDINLGKRVAVAALLAAAYFCE